MLLWYMEGWNKCWANFFKRFILFLFFIYYLRWQTVILRMNITLLGVFLYLHAGVHFVLLNSLVFFNLKLIRIYGSVPKKLANYPLLVDKRCTPPPLSTLAQLIIFSLGNFSTHLCWPLSPCPNPLLSKLEMFKKIFINNFF